MTNIAIKKPPQSVFRLGRDLDELNILHLKDTDKDIKHTPHEEHEPTKSEVTLTTVTLQTQTFLSSSSLSPLPSFHESSSSPDKGHNNIEKIKQTIDTAASKVDSVSELADTAMQRIQERLAQCKENIRQTAVAIEKQNEIEWETAKQRRLQKDAHSKAEKEKKLKHEAGLKFAAKRNEQLFQLEKLKADILDARSEKRRLLRWAVKLDDRKKYDDETPTQILDASNYFTIGECDDDEQERQSGKFINDEETTSTNVDSESIQEEYMQQSKEPMTLEEMRLAAKAEAAKEIRMAKEVKNRLMEKLAKEREDAKLAHDVNKEGLETIQYNEDDADKFIAGVKASTICEFLGCTIEQLYESDQADLPIESGLNNIDDPLCNINDIQSTINDLMNDIQGYNTRLVDIQMMQSVILAENAALKGKDEFNIDCETEQFSEIKRENKLSLEGAKLKFDFDRISKRAGQTVKQIRLAAARVDDKNRSKQKKNFTM